MRWPAAAVLALVCTAAWATAEEPHFSGRSRDGHDISLSLVGGAFVGQSGPWLRIATPVQITRRGRALHADVRCVYAYQPQDHAHARIECAEQPSGRMAGVVYARKSKADDALRCIHRCGPQVPAVLHLHDDDGHR
jgi:hypothetical protein